MSQQTPAFGFLDLEGFMGQQASLIGEKRISDAIKITVEEYNRQWNSVLALQCEFTEDAKIRFDTVGGGELQTATSGSLPLPTQDLGSQDLAWPIQAGHDSYGSDHTISRMATVADYSKYVLSVQAKDVNWMMRHFLHAVMNKTTYTFVDKLIGSLSIKPLANNDTDTYPAIGGSYTVAQNYLGQNGALADNLNMYQTIATQLRGFLGNEGPIVACIPPILETTTRALATFVSRRDMNVEPGSASARLLTEIDRGFADEVIGYISGAGVWVCKWSRLSVLFSSALASTDAYIYAYCPEAPIKPVRIREYPFANMKGLYTTQHNTEGGLKVNAYRHAGFGGYGRSHAAAAWIGNSTTYPNPSIYTSNSPLGI